MSERERWLLPEGIDEVLPPRARRVETLRRSLLDLFDCWGYELVMPPFIEFVESLLVGTGSDLDLSTFKLIDQLTGRLMGVRADMTPQVARIDAHRLGRRAPTRLCYVGTVLHTTGDGRGASRSPTQIGAELYGHAGIESDVEVASLMLETLAAARVPEVHLDLGHVGVFRALARAISLEPAEEADLHEALQRKAGPEVEAQLDGRDPRLAGAILSLAELNGGTEVLERARRSLGGTLPAVDEAIAALAALASALERLFPDLPVHVDLAELRGYRYHTGVVFAAFVPGYGHDVARGGRYDEIGAAFGRARAATGFSTRIGTLVELADRDAMPAPAVGVLAPPGAGEEVAALVRALRADGERVVSALEGPRFSAAELGCDREIVFRDGVWKVAPAGTPLDGNP